MPAITTGRTATKWIRFLIDDSGSTLREIPINKLSMVGFVYGEQDLTAYQDAVKGALPSQPDCPIEISGPFDITTPIAAGGTGAAPALSGSHPVLSAIAGLSVPLTLDIRFGMRQYWTAGEPVFGITATSTAGFVCVNYTVAPDDMMYSAKFVLFPGSTAPEWGTAAHT